MSKLCKAQCGGRRTHKWIKSATTENVWCEFCKLDWSWWSEQYGPDAPESAENTNTATQKNNASSATFTRITAKDRLNGWNFEESK